MGKRGRDIDNDPSLTIDLVSNFTTSRITKSALAKFFETLHAHGMLDTLASRRQISTRVSSAASVETPFGAVIQTLDLGHGTTVEFCHPAALLHYLCTISQTFADVCKHAALAKGDGAKLEKHFGVKAQAQPRERCRPYSKIPLRRAIRR